MTEVETYRQLLTDILLEAEYGEMRNRYNLKMAIATLFNKYPDIIIGHDPVRHSVGIQFLSKQKEEQIKFDGIWVKEDENNYRYIGSLMKVHATYQRIKIPIVNKTMFAGGGIIMFKDKCLSERMMIEESETAIKDRIEKWVQAEFGRLAAVINTHKV
jgi:hypothetical protein